MKGIVFTLMAELVEEKFGLDVWDKVIEVSKLPSDGIYTSGDTYPESEFITILKTLSKQTNTSETKLCHLYGEFMFHKLAKRYPTLVPQTINLKEFLKTIDSVIHVEVMKLHPTAELPRFTYEEPYPDQLIMNYKSPRKLCYLAEGLIEGAAQHYNENVRIEQPVCMHHGADHCSLKLTFSGKK